MRQRTCFLLICLMGVSVKGYAQEMAALHIDRGSIYYQPSEDIIVPIGAVAVGEPSWFFSVGAAFSEGSVTNPRISGPSFSGGYPMEAYVWEGIEYDFEMTFHAEEELVAFAPAGDYVFSGSGSSIGTFTETITMGTYEALEPKRILNLAPLQGIDPDYPFAIEWESFADAGEMGFIEVDIYASSDWGWDIIWESPEDEGSFGLDTETTSIEVPAGTLDGHGRRNFEVVVCFTRIDSFGESSVFAGGIKAYVTSTQTVAKIRLKPPQGYVSLTPDDWCEDDCYGWMFGVTNECGYSHDLGYLWIGYTPGYIYQYYLGWLAYGGGTMKTGCWFYSHAMGWTYTHEGLGGWFITMDGHWHSAMGP